MVASLEAGSRPASAAGDSQESWYSQFGRNVFTGSNAPFLDLSESSDLRRGLSISGFVSNTTGVWVNSAAYSMYRGGGGSLLCIISRNDAFHFPPGGQTVKGIHLYRYNGFSIAATNRYAVFCLMVTRLPVADLARAFDRLPA
jgi:hypothetical protein